MLIDAPPSLLEEREEKRSDRLKVLSFASSADERCHPRRRSRDIRRHSAGIWVLRDASIVKLSIAGHHEPLAIGLCVWFVFVWLNRVERCWFNLNVEIPYVFVHTTRR